MKNFKGGLNGVARFSSGCVKGFLNGVSRFSDAVTHFSSGCVTACSRESKSETPENPPPLFVNVTLKVKEKKGLWIINLEKIMAGMADMEGVVSCVASEDGKVNISGHINRTQFMKRLQKYSGKVEVEHFQFGICSNHLYRKKEAPSTKKAGPSTINTNPTTNNANTAIGYYQPQGYGAYYGNVGRSGNGGYDNFGFYGNGGYNGNIYNNQPEPAVYQKRIGYDHIDCAGDASECSGHHIEKAVTTDKSQDKSSKNTVEKPAGSPKRN